MLSGSQRGRVSNPTLRTAMDFALSKKDIVAFKCLFILLILYGIMSIGSYFIIHMKHIKPLDSGAPLNQFSEGRAIDHVTKLSKEIDGRQEGRLGLKKAAEYLKMQLNMIAARAANGTRMEIEESVIEGSFNMHFLGHSISSTYRGHVNIIARISSANSRLEDPSVLVNGHFDSPLGSPGAGDCASCVASMLEVIRVIIDSQWDPPRPLVFLFNGAEELFLLGSHGFMESYAWKDYIGVFINIEASGTGGPDLLCQSGPGSWPSLIYAKSTLYPMAHSAAQDIFPYIPGDTDFRVFTKDYGDIPGLDIIFLLGGYFYHTSSDTVEKLLPGSIQARGENLFSMIKAFSGSPDLLTSQQRKLHAASTVRAKHDRAIFFDYLSWIMVFYSQREAIVLHSLPIILFMFLPLLNFHVDQPQLIITTFFILIRGVLLHIYGFVLAVMLPVILSIIRLLFSDHAMNWFCRPYLALLMFVPSALGGLIIPHIWEFSPLYCGDSCRRQAICGPEVFWGSFGFYASLALAYLAAGFGGGFLPFFISASMIMSWFSFHVLVKYFGNDSLISFAGYILPMLPCLTYTIYFGGFVVEFFIEKMGMMGSFPQPYAHFVADILVAVVIGVTINCCVGPLMPVARHWLARRTMLLFLLHVSVLAAASTSQFFPYCQDAPKRVVLQHSFYLTDMSMISRSSYDISVVDANSLTFLLKHAPEAAKALNVNSELNSENAYPSNMFSWLALFPVPLLFSGSSTFPTTYNEVLDHYEDFPSLSSKQSNYTAASRRVYLELDLGSLQEVWVTVLNITGPLSNWSFANYMLSEPEIVNNGPPSYICRLSGKTRSWKFWLEVSRHEYLRLDVAVLDQHLSNATQELKGRFPEWVDVIAYTSFLSTYYV